MEIWVIGTANAWKKTRIDDFPGQRALAAHMATIIEKRALRTSRRASEWLVFAQSEIEALAKLYATLFPAHEDVEQNAYRLLCLHREKTVRMFGTAAPTPTWVYAHDARAVIGPSDQRHLALWFND